MAQSVARNAQYRRGGLGIRQRHNERQNADYMNDDIIRERAALNVHYKQPQGSYESAFDKMVADGAISTRGLQKDAFIVDELVFDVNTAYFESGGGYDYAVSFFEEAYRCAVEEIGGEEYVLSAVMHADERNKAISEQLGRDVYHYHLHVVYVPVVDKEIYFKKNNKDPEKAGKLRE
ncbi:MAG: plasmid recombination protein, partial [Oscillospiraceae bacterium]|nr:plasmid recombination protein [Oscillospiraceae bacterium]